MMSVRLQLALCYLERDSFVYHLTWRRKACVFSLPFDLTKESMFFFVTI